MQAGNLKLAGATLALAALVAGCSDSTSNETAVPSLAAPKDYVQSPVVNGTAWACKFTVDPVTGNITGDFSSGSITAALISGAPAVTAGPQAISWPTGTQCVKVWQGTAAAQISVTETPSAGYALSYYKIATPTDQNPFTRIYVNADNSPSPTGGTVTLNVDGSGQWEVWFKNVPFTPPPPPSGGQGCTPGFWKNSPGSWQTYTPNQLFSSVFENAFPGKTLIEVAGLGGGGLNALGRHTVAALLNAAAANPDVNYAYTTAQVISSFNAAFPGTNGAYEAQKNAFATQNEKGCPLANDNSFGN